MSTGANAIPRGVRGKPPVKKAGPRPARHIPWPEIFKHHISLVEGHLKMIDMVRKHTVEGSGNHRTISNLVDRAHSMLKDAKAVQREFVAPKDAWQSVPIGSSSDTMYPGYSPKDHEYGKAAQEFGKEWSEARKRGVDFNTGPDGPEYQFGQSKASKKRRIEQLANAESMTTVSKSEDQDANPDTATGKAQDDAPLFFFDSKPTPINGVGKTSGTGQTSANQDSQPEATSNSRGPQSDDEEPVIEYENIDREVEARLKLKADAQKNKKDRKRKRGSGTPVDTAQDAAPEAGTSAELPPAKKSRSRKKGKKDKTTDNDSAPADTEMADLPLRDKTGADESTAVAEMPSTNGDSTSTSPKKANKHRDEPKEDKKRKKGRKSTPKE